MSRLFASALCLVLASAPASAEECPAVPPDASLPDLVNMIPHHIHVQEGHQRHHLLFTTGLANIGAGPLELEPESSLSDPDELVNAFQHVFEGPTNESAPVCERSLAEVFEFHPDHNHWHLTGANSFGVFAALDDGSMGQWAGGPVGSRKQTFCLIDYVPFNDDALALYGLPEVRREYFDCFRTQGISVGWVDYYHHSTHGQFIDITGAAEGVYYLVLTANPDGTFLESDYGNNTAWVSFRLRYNGRNNAMLDVLYDSFGQTGDGLEPPHRTNR
jgi:hypothetical protein